jgi:hypothetical protein
MATNATNFANSALNKVKHAPGFGGFIGMDPDSMRTMDFIDTDKDGTDDRNQRGPGQPYITWDQAKQEEKNSFRQNVINDRNSRGGAGTKFPGAKNKQPRSSRPTGNYAKQYMDDFAGYTNTQKAKVPSDFGKYQAATPGGSLFNQGWGNMVNWGNKFKDNEAIQGFISGSRLDTNQNMMNMGLDLLYQKGQLSQMADYQGGMENLKTGNTLKLLAAEGGIVRDMMWDQGDISSRQIGERGDQEVRGIRTLGDENRKTQRDRYREDRKMRADARGAIRRTGSKFFG